MADQITETARLENWHEWSPTQLANSWLDFQTGQLEGRIKDAENEINFYETYKPKIPARPSSVESGSKDADDWAVAEEEFANWPEEQEAKIEFFSGEKEGLEEQLVELDEKRRGIQEGDQGLIEECSELERTRREKEEALQKAKLGKDK